MLTINNLNNMRISNILFENIEATFGSCIFAKLNNSIIINTITVKNVSSRNGGIFYLENYNDITCSNLNSLSIVANEIGSLIYSYDYNNIIFESFDIQHNSGSLMFINN